MAMTPTERELLFCQYCTLYMMLPDYLDKVRKAIDSGQLDERDIQERKIHEISKHIKQRTFKLIESLESLDES